jgi:hypothetical protein
MEILLASNMCALALISLAGATRLIKFGQIAARCWMVTASLLALAVLISYASAGPVMDTPGRVGLVACVVTMSLAWFVGELPEP